MEIEPVGWVVQRHLIDPRLDELDVHVPSFEFGRSPIRAIRLPSDLLVLDTRSLEDVALQAMTLLASGEVTSAG
ncbi:hypothetical protein ISU10_17430 [Nocardioides agariphilus]|jgi:hypothetical protein|uniref:Uncharacterized protein n=1 Tax=Nocardioides agariphilus TaxID=433664 RepID=A0A930VRB4_9ACTN|nr:hypothetical protein [Nocardioides agariphilus]MBF4769553.1 hypothetical protein [Nocardioides agariphilus]